MAQLQHTEAKILDSHFLEGRNSVLSTSATALQKGSEPYKIDWELNRKLQTSLYVNEVSNIFFSSIQSEFNFAQMIFDHKNSDTSITLGDKTARHSCNYQIEIAGESLGHLSFTRSIRFAEHELNRLEELLCLLVYPLRNALLYEDALKKAMHDPLTGALNRAALDTMLDKEIDLAHRHDNPLSILMVDIDHFKQINDNYGHGMGDKVLRSLVDGLKSHIRNSDILFRYGGEEFTILLNNTSVEGAHLLAQRVRNSIEQMSHIYDDTVIQLTISVGMATLEINENATQLLERSDSALYAAKKFGRNCVIKA